MSVTPMINRVSAKNKYHFQNDPEEMGPGWKYRPGITTRQLFSDSEGYRVTLVRFDEATAEPEGLQSGDEHLFVLSGQVFIDYKEYGPGSYVFTPAGMSPSIYSLEGCSMLVHRLPASLIDSDPKESNQKELGSAKSRTILETQMSSLLNSRTNWEEVSKGVFALPLFEQANGNYKSALYRYLPGAYMPEHMGFGDEHTYILKGSLEDGLGSYDTGGYAFNPRETNLQVWSEEGCLALVHWRETSSNPLG
jgi:quercetin dioxygenase-like cupin family protein